MKLLTKINFNKKTEEADKFCKFDFDPVPEVIEEHLKLSGWVVGIESPAVGIELIQDGQLVREVPLTIDRPLPNQIYATFPGAEQSGFIIDTTLEKINLESVHILIQAVLENFQRISLASLNVYKDEETIQDLAQTKAELDETREELERLQSQFDEVLAELEQAHSQLNQIKKKQSQKASINSNDKVNKQGNDSGWTETTKDKFNPALYIASNARLIESIGYDLEAAEKHYLEEGYPNNWPIDLFNPHSYLGKYKDLSNAFGDNLGGATRHYIVNGYKEGRFWTNNLSVVEAVLQREPEHKGARKEKFLTTWKRLQNPQVNTQILSKAMTNRIGIGVVTYNRLEYLKGCIKNIQQYTQSPYYLIIADDGSTDGTVEWCRSEGLVVITGQNRGVCWNKNRALYTLKEYTDANCIMLLEDDCWPTETGWELAWLQTTAIWHHVNYAPPWIVKHNPDAIYQNSDEMPTSPYLLKLLTGQCTTSSRQALNCVGYLDSRFQGYGHGHVEWTKRFMRCSSFIESLPVPIGETYPAINKGLTTQKSISYSNEAERQKNAQILNSLANEPIYRSPWQNDEEKFIFLQEVSSVQYSLLQQVSRISSAIWFNTLNPSPQISTAQIVQASVKEAQLPTPRMSEAEVTLFTKYLQEQKVVIEFGAGGSTGLAIKTGVKQLYSVESNLEFIKKLQEYTLIQKAVEEGQVKFFYINIGPVGAWGHPRDRSSQENWPKYYSDIWKEASQPIDLVFIDGRFRVACALQSLSHIHQNAKVIMHDFWDRPSYHDVLKFFDPIESADTLVVLQPKNTIDHHLLSAMIEQYKYIAA